jgi:hypothetical protein
MRPRTICFQRKTYSHQYGGAGCGENGGPVEVEHKKSNANGKNQKPMNFE